MNTRPVYLAARFSRREELQGYMRELEAAGVTVTSRWLKEDHGIPDDGLTDSAWAAEAQRFAEDDYRDIAQASILVAFSEPPRTTATRGGRHVEFGIAAALGHDLVVVGPRENVFHRLPGVRQVDTWSEARDLVVALAIGPNWTMAPAGGA